MKRKYEDVAFDRIKTLKQEIDTYINRLGKEKLIEILLSRFGISDKDAARFLKIMEEMIPGVPFYAIPQERFFAVHNALFDPISDSRDDIRKDRMIITAAIKLFWEMPEELKTKVLDLWPKVWHDYLLRKEINTGDEIKKYSATEIANLILSKRYKCKPSTINTYSKAEKFF